jgi:gamma-glutamylcyclotransferase
VTHVYFAYGSNMDSARLAARVKNARPLGAGRLVGHRLTFDKRGADGSGKANIRAELGAVVHGVLFNVAQRDLEKLDGFEPGYTRSLFGIVGSGSETIEAWAYVHPTPTSGLMPRSWYVQHLLTGAREHLLPTDLIRSFEELLAKIS